MNAFLSRHRVMLQWAFPVGLLFVILLIALAPAAVSAAVGLVALFFLSYLGIPLIYRQRRERSSGTDSTR
jgi:hypothetical protein